MLAASMVAEAQSTADPRGVFVYTEHLAQDQQEVVFPGEFQINVTVPAALADGDQPIVAIYNGSQTQAGTLLTVQH